MLALVRADVEPRVDVIVNRLAHELTREDGVLRALRRAAATAPDRATLHETRSLVELTAVVSRVRDRGTDLVILAGGDGSCLAGTTALRDAFGDALPRVAFAPGGTVGTVARNWGASGNDAKYAERLVTAALAGDTRIDARPTLAVRDDQGGDRVGFIFGAGLVARFFDAYYEGETLGSLRAAALVARIFVGTFTSGGLAERVLRPSPARLIVDGRAQVPEAWSLIAASVVRDLGLHMRLLYRAGEDAHAFHVVASPLPARRLSPQVGRVLLGRPLRGADNVDRLARELRVELPGPEASTYVLDGERLRARVVTVTAGPTLRYVSLGE